MRIIETTPQYGTCPPVFFQTKTTASIYYVVTKGPAPGIYADERVIELPSADSFTDRKEAVKAWAQHCRTQHGRPCPIAGSKMYWVIKGLRAVFESVMSRPRGEVSKGLSEQRGVIGWGAYGLDNKFPNFLASAEFVGRPIDFHFFLLATIYSPHSLSTTPCPPNQKGAVGGSSGGNGDDARGRRGYPEDENSEEGRRAAEAEAAAKKRAKELAEIQRMQACITEAARHQIEISRDEEQQAKKQIEDMERLDTSKVVTYARKMGIDRSVVAKKPEERGAPPGSIIKVRKVATSGSLIGLGKCKVCIRFGDDCISKMLTNGDNSCRKPRLERSGRSEDPSTPPKTPMSKKRGRDGKQIPDPNHPSCQRILRSNPLTRRERAEVFDRGDRDQLREAIDDIATLKGRIAELENREDMTRDLTLYRTTHNGRQIVVLRHFLLQLLQAKGEEEFHWTRVWVAEEIRDWEPGFSWAMSHRPVAPVWYHYSESTPIGPLNEGEHGFLPRLPPIDTWGLYPAKSPSEEHCELSLCDVLQTSRIG
ncbi:hypothetical protein B0H16DRAFT_1474991 [Mycena metata]|uniref:Uncharacterized protein n=1 Tax=Mycena metata TaxID=1033252 RepID=A0AAD7HF75_9AGAR|nr:hypothetical protein B0H16DRAFT_1474991 [Mycena metata]